MENLLQAKPMHHTYTQQNTALASTCLCPRVTLLYSVLANKSPSSPGACCQSTLYTGWLTHRDFVLDRLIQLVGHRRTKYSWAAVAPPTSFHSCLVFLLSYPHTDRVGTETDQVFPRPIRRLFTAVIGEERTAVYNDTIKTQGNYWPNLFMPPGHVRCRC